MKSLRDISHWKNSLGLLPIKQFSSSQYNNKYILLNGGTGDFCLDIGTEFESKEFYYSSAWSSNTKHYVSLKNDDVTVFNWKKNEVKSYDLDKVNDNLYKFYLHIFNNSFRSEDDIVPFVISIFRRIRNLYNNKTNPVESLEQLFFLLASLENTPIDTTLWGISDNVWPHKDLEKYIIEFKKGVSGIEPKLDLIIRHSLGMVFQEAQKEVLFFDKQMSLFSPSTLSDNYLGKSILYSSVHHTPSYLARCIVENALSEIDLGLKKTLKILDPSCGSSEFLMEVLKQLKAFDYHGQIEIHGWDSSEIAIKTSRFLLTYEKRNWKNRLSINLKLVNDSLSENWDTDFDIILMNPPFVSWEQLGNKEYRDHVRESLGKAFDGKPNQASAFFYKAIHSLKKEGVIGTVIPSSLLTMDAYKKLRDEIKDIASLRLIGKLGNYVFEDALVDVSIIIAHKSKEENNPLVIWTNNEKGIATVALREYRKMLYSNIPYVDRDNFSIYRPTIEFKDNWKPISVKESVIVNSLRRLLNLGRLVEIEKIFNVQQGVRTGNNQAFKISAEEYSKLDDNEQIFFRPVIDNDSIKYGAICEKSNYIWYPYNDSGLIINSEEELKQLCPNFYLNHFISKGYKEILSKRARKSLENWWTLSEHRAWLRTKEKRLVSTEFGTSSSFSFDASGEFIIERGNGWLPKKDFKEIEDFYFYLSIFTSPVFDKLLSIYSKQLLSGWDLGKKYTKDIPIPKILKVNSSDDTDFIITRESPVYIQLVQFGKSISTGDFFEHNSRDGLIKQFIYPVF